MRPLSSTERVELKSGRVKSDDNGRYDIEDIPCGEYRLKISTPGFAQFEVGANMKSDDVRQENAVLGIAGVAESAT